MGEPQYADCVVDMSAIDLNRRLTQAEKTSRRTWATSVFVSGQTCIPCEGEAITDECEIKMKVNLFAGETGYFEVEGCEGPNPTLHLTINKTYKFDQSDSTNWYHLIGFAYEPDGALADAPELEPGISGAEGFDGGACESDSTCPAPMYFKNSTYQGSYSNIAALATVTTGDDDFGLEAVEPEFFYPLGDWQEEGGTDGYATYLNYDKEYDQDIFYFCHIHAGMSGRIKLLDADGNMLNSADTPAIYDYDIVSEYDQIAGTVGLDGFNTPNDQCPEQFVCESTSSEESGAEGVSLFGSYVDSMNCAMLDGMTVQYGGEPTTPSVQGVEYNNDAVLFMRQMIPHHQNAVNMAKAAMTLGTFDCDSTGTVAEGVSQDSACVLSPIMMSIVNVQNKQIQTMLDVLGSLGVDSVKRDCDVDDDTVPAPGPTDDDTTPAPGPTDDDTAPTPGPTDESDEGCCSQDFKTCIGWCGTTQSTCGSCNSNSYAWLEDGENTGTCKARWKSCTNDSSSCCPGLHCFEWSIWYSQCLP